MPEIFLASQHNPLYTQDTYPINSQYPESQYQGFLADVAESYLSANVFIISEMMTIKVIFYGSKKMEITKSGL